MRSKVPKTVGVQGHDLGPQGSSKVSMPSCDAGNCRPQFPFNLRKVGISRLMPGTAFSEERMWMRVLSCQQVGVDCARRHKFERQRLRI